MKREIEEVSSRTGGNERKRGKDESVQRERAGSEVIGDNEGVATTPDQTIDDGAAAVGTGDLADTEDDQQIIHGVPETRRSGRARKPVQRFDDDKYAPFGRPVNSIFQANDVSKAMKKLKEAGAGPSSRSREVTMSESPDPIALYPNDLDRGMATEHSGEAPKLEQESSPSYIPDMTDPPTPPQQMAQSEPPRTNIEPKKSALKQKTSSGPREKRGVIIDETKNTTRSIKIISSTSSDIGRLPGGGPGSRGGRGRGRVSGRGRGQGRGRGRGSTRFGVRPRNLIPINPDVLARRTVPVFGMSGTGERIVQKYRYVVSSDSDLEEVTSDGDDPLGTQRRAHSRGTMIDKDNRIFLLSLAARTNTRPDSSALPPSGPEEEYETQVTRIGTLVSRSLTPTRPSLPFKSKHPDNIEQEKVRRHALYTEINQLIVGMEDVCGYHECRVDEEASSSSSASCSIWTSYRSRSSDRLLGIARERPMSPGDHVPPRRSTSTETYGG